MDKESEGEKGRAERERQGDRETKGEREREIEMGRAAFPCL